MQRRCQDGLLAHDLLQVQDMVLINPERPILFFYLQGPAGQNVNGRNERLFDPECEWRLYRLEAPGADHERVPSQVPLNEHAHLGAGKSDLTGHLRLEVRLALHEIGRDTTQIGHNPA